MNNDNRINLDDDLIDLQTTLANDVAEAAKAAKDRKENDEKKDAEHKKDSQIKYTLIALGAVLIFLLAYWMTFVRSSAPPEVPIVNYQPKPAPSRLVKPQQPTRPQPINRPPANTMQPSRPPAGQSPDETASPDM